RIFPGDDWYIGFHINATNGNMAWIDEGPRIAGKGAWLRIISWLEYPDFNDFNFCIEGIFITQNYAEISGSIAYTSQHGDMMDTTIRSGVYETHRCSGNTYTLTVKPGSYDVTASKHDYISDSIDGITVTAGEQLTGQDFSLTYIGTPVTDETVPGSVITLLNNYPNPFNPETCINFKLSEQATVSLSIYNIKGEKVRQLANSKFSSGEHKLTFNGLSDSGKALSSGIYFYALKTADKTLTRKMILMK
ncbi:MAG: T9SS type A sorting domain-containing protein, partial [Candidatus Cloacimonetes bacterium]|nr:T9SS type A sorting domain-containing protein [Candidatus Cloacimonadota bacterium]